MDKNRKNNLNKNNIELKIECENFIEVREHVKPWQSAMKIILLYLLIGSLWILLSDKILAAVVTSDELYQDIQLYKGWFYVLITGLIFFYIINKTLVLYQKAVETVLKGYEELNSSSEELTEMNRELDQQNDELEDQKKALLISEQRYQLAVEGANDGIWDWDLQTDNYFFSENWKNGLGYEEDELSNDFHSWEKLFHPEDIAYVHKAVHDYLERKHGIYECIYRVRKKSGEYRWILSKGKGVWDETGRPIRIAGSHTDITERRNMEEALQHLAYFDTLTELPNRVCFEQETKKKIFSGEKFALINLDIDDFRHINDLMGHAIGDIYIQNVAKVLKNTLEEETILARISGGQFGILFLNIKDTNDIKGQIEALLTQIRNPMYINGQIFLGTVSIGIAIYPEHGTDCSSLIQNAEIAMYHQKEHGKDGYSFFEYFMYDKISYLLQMSKELKEAIKREEFLLYYQPQYDLITGELIALEALIRWNHPKKGFIPPMEFIPFSEKTGHIIPISEWVFERVIQQKREWEEKGHPPVKIAINLSGYVLTESESVEAICNIFKKSNLQPGEIEIEVTETALMIELTKAKECLEKLRSYGVTVALDDFGTGYSSLTYLNTLPFDILKIDREFIKNVVDENEDIFIYKAVIELAHNMSLKVVAEGVETEEQQNFLLKNCCDIGQGYYFSKPVPAEEMENIFNKKGR